jgi:hypothetical protein
MKSFSIRNLAPLAVTAALVCMPLVALAVTSIDGVGGAPTSIDGSGGVPGNVNGSGGTPQPAPSYPTPTPNVSGGTPNCNGGPCSVRNPLKVTNFCDLLKIVLQAMLIIGLPVAVIFLVLAGLQFITAYGNSTKITDARKNLQWTVIGVAIFLGAWTIAQIIKATLVSLGVGGFGSC